MAIAARKNSSKTAKPRYIGKPAGLIQQRVEAVGPSHFGVVSVDCAKSRSKWMLCDFYGKVIIEPTDVKHDAGSLIAMGQQIQIAFQEFSIKDAIAAVEMTGIYHASINGYGLATLPVDETFQSLQRLNRHRGNLVKQRAKLQVQIRNLMHQSMPGYDELFIQHHFFKKSVAMPVAKKFSSAAAIKRAGSRGLAKHLRKMKTRFQQPTLDRIVAWSKTAAEEADLVDMLTDHCSVSPESTSSRPPDLLARLDRSNTTQRRGRSPDELVCIRRVIKAIRFCVLGNTESRPPRPSYGP